VNSLNRSDSNGENWKFKSKPEEICNKPYRTTSSYILRRPTANIGKEQFQADQDHAMKWSGAISMEIELMMVKVQTEVTNMRERVDWFHKEADNK